MTKTFPSADQYAAEPIKYPALTVIDIQFEQAAVTVDYQNQVLAKTNGECLRLAVFEGEYRWHCHPDSDELFLVVEGLLQIDLADAPSLELRPWQCVVIPAGRIHRTRAIGRTVNLTYEKLGALATFVDTDT
jgi:mannose-6-phosphate isomerase-like protein (cupin superfamily)